jgi:hypothetical protein
MGAGILPVTIHKDKLYFLFGKENKYADTPGWSDFGGGTETKESFLNTAAREATEELTGFLGDEKDIKRMLTKHGTFNIDNTSSGHGTYRMHIFPMEYNELLPLYYNNNQRFLQRRLDPKVIKNSTIFEKDEIKWICIDDLDKMRKKFRHYFTTIIDKILDNHLNIENFVNNAFKKSIKNKTRKNKY